MNKPDDLVCAGRWAGPQWAQIESSCVHQCQEGAVVLWGTDGAPLASRAEKQSMTTGTATSQKITPGVARSAWSAVLRLHTVPGHRHR